MMLLGPQINYMPSKGHVIVLFSAWITFPVFCSWGSKSSISVWIAFPVYLRVTLLRSVFFHVFSKPTNDRIESVAYNSSWTRKHAKLLTVWAWQFIMRHRNCVSITTNKLRFHCLVSNIWLAGIENGTFDWLDLKMLESIVSVLPSDWFSLSGWPPFQ